MRRVALLLAIALGALGLGLPVFGNPPIDPAEPLIRLKAATFEPLRGEPILAPGLRHRALGAHERGTSIVQFVGPIEDAWKAAVVAAGGELLEYVPEFAFKVRMTPAQSLAVRRLPSVRWVGLFHPAYKLSPRLTRNGERLYVVRLEPGSDETLAAAAIDGSGARVLRREGRTLVVSASAERLDALAAVQDVAWIEDFVLRKKHNDKGGGVIMGAATANGSGYDGSTQTVAIADTGLGGGTAATAHAHIPASRVAAIYDWPGTPRHLLPDDRQRRVAGRGQRPWHARRRLGPGRWRIHRQGEGDGTRGTTRVPVGGELRDDDRALPALRLSRRLLPDRDPDRHPAALPAGLRRRGPRALGLLGQRRGRAVHRATA